MFLKEKTMKRLFFLPLFFIVFTLIVSCSNDDDREPKSTTLIFTPSASITNSQDLRYGLGAFGDPELTRIVYQAENAEVSELVEHPETGEIYYYYKPKSGFIGRDYVQIQTETGPLGSPDSSPVIIAKITIEVSF